ncbi:LysR family transcriptional regulator [Tissierella sp.]|uniref:LysR family transcriptional regulator n=1 Tax=Tissierella sp. TaxID=41274 RepID=UPI00285A7D40|nr:LysR family transcriptional regulator [Tissierella sp.]MDR7855501.1 LysR family transcriptional regulator [Tissierella sp.]
MDIRQLKYFVTIAEEGSITAAADRLYITQPPLSRQLKSMEKELGVTLFDRTNKKNMKLTPAGENLLKNSKTILNSMDEAITEVKEIEQHMTDKLSIGTTIYCSEILLPVLENFCEKHPFIVPEIHEGSISYLIDLLKNHIIDIAISPLPFDMDGLTYKELQQDTCVFVTTQDFKFTDEYITLDKISQIPLLLLDTPDSNSLYKRILNEFQKKGIKITISCICNDSGLLLRMLLGNFGSTIIPYSMINNKLRESVQVIPIKNNPWTTTSNLIWRNEGYVSYTIKEFIKSIKS